MIIQMSLPLSKILLDRSPLYPPHTGQHLIQFAFQLSVSSCDIVLLVCSCISASDSRSPRIVTVVWSSTFVSAVAVSSTFQTRLVVEESVGCGTDLVYMPSPVSSWP